MTGATPVEGRLAEALRGRVAERHEIRDDSGFGLIRKAAEEAARVARVL